MSKGDTVVLKDDATWHGTVLAIGTNVELRWDTGPLEGKVARVPKELLRKAKG